jgi:hypothetical protein
MMGFIASLLVGKLEHILLLAVAFLVGYLDLRFKVFGITRRPRPWLLPPSPWPVIRLGNGGSEPDAGGRYPGAPCLNMAGFGNEKMEVPIKK